MNTSAPTATPQEPADALQALGFALVPGVLTLGECSALAREVESDLAGLQPLKGGAHRATSASGGQRSMLERPWCQALARRLQQLPSLAGLMPAESVAVQCTYFEKTPARNWLVPLHQDLSIPVAERVPAPELRGWSDKDGALFVQPPVPLLQTLVAVRVHLDPCHADDGPLRVVPASHLHGVLTADAAQALRAAGGDVVCLADAGTALALRPLLLHASSKASGTSRRRVLHFVFGPAQLPCGLRWPDAAVGC